MTAARATALHLLFVVALLGFLGLIGAIAGAIGGILLLVVSSPVWAAFVARYPGSEDTLIAIAIGGGGLCGAVASLALIARLAFRADQALTLGDPS